MGPRCLVLLPLALLAACSLSDFPSGVFTPPWSSVYGAARDERAMADILVDKGISTQVKAALLNGYGELGLRVKVYCFLRRVTLLGQVDDVDLRAFAVTTAWEVEGVRGVATGWVAQSRADTGLADLEIAARLRAALVGDEGLSATQIEAEVFGGTVYLVGLVRSRQDVERAVAHALGVRGVSTVTSLLIPTGGN